MTESPSDTAAPGGLAGRYAEMVGARAHHDAFGTAKIEVDAASWVDAHRTLRAHLPFFSYLSAIDWASDPAVGDPPEDAVEERYEVMTRLADVSDGAAVIVSTSISKDDPRLASLVEVYGGADWHEREAHEMFGISFEGHPNPANLYLPDGFEGHPLRKTFPLLSREVKPWPGTVDVEDMPGSENAEAGDGVEEEGG